MAGQVFTTVGLIVCLMTSCGHGQIENASQYLAEGNCGSGGRERVEGQCPTWTWPHPHHNLNCCNLGITVDRIVRWSAADNLSILFGFCMTHDSSNDTEYLASCPYGRNVIDMYRVYHSLPLNSSHLNSAMCDPFHRRGKLCGQCKPGYGIAIYSDNINCYSCSGRYQGWTLYLALELIPVTLMFIFLIVVQCSISRGHINCFLFFAQVISYAYQISPPEGSFPFGKTSEAVIRVYQVGYGLFNFDLFRKMVPPFCVSEGLSSLQAISLLYLSMLYLLLLIALTYALIEMHAHNCRVLVWLWRPFNKYYMKIHQHINQRNSLIHAFAMSLLLSYSRLLYISLVLLRPTALFTPKGGTGKQVLVQDGGIVFLSQEHLPYVLLSCSVVIVFNITPILFLFAYPTTFFQKVLGKSVFGKVSCILHACADVIQGCYKNGTEGTRDCRYFSGLYLVLRIAVCIGPAFPFYNSNWIVASVLFLIMSVLFANVRPYRQDRYNTADSIWFALGTLFAVFQVIIGTRGIEHTKGYQIISQVGLGLPLAYWVCYELCIYLRRVWNYCLQRLSTVNANMTDTASGYQLVADE